MNTLAGSDCFFNMHTLLLFTYGLATYSLHSTDFCFIYLTARNAEQGGTTMDNDDDHNNKRKGKSYTEDSDRGRQLRGTKGYQNNYLT